MSSIKQAINEYCSEEFGMDYAERAFISCMEYVEEYDFDELFEELF